MKRERSEELYRVAKQYFPGGVNSPVRAFRSVGGTPLFIERGDGCRIWDADGNCFIDFCGSWGPLILGHNSPEVRKAVVQAVESGTSFGAPTRLENELAGLILENHPVPEMIRFVSSGTEAVMSALRLARGFTGRSRILKFEGCYHGHVDSMLVRAGSGLSTFGVSTSAGIPPEVAADTLVVPLGDRAAVEEVFRVHGAELAAVIIEPVPANNGLLLQEPDFLQLLRELTRQHGALLIFDEVISGFRLGFGGASALYDIRPDLITFGKIIGGGLPVGAYGGRADILRHISPEGRVYQAGTLSGNPVAMAAGLAQLRACLQENFYQDLEAKTQRFISLIRAGMEKHLGRASADAVPLRIVTIGSVFWFAFTRREVIRRADEIDPAGMELFRRLHAALLENGVYFGPSGYEVGFVSAAHTPGDLEEAAEKISRALSELFRAHPAGVTETGFRN